MRKGVPIILELQNNTQLSDIYNMGNLRPENPLIIDL
jgi:hypothetical protein